MSRRRPHPPRAGLRRLARPLVVAPVLAAVLVAAGTWFVLGRDDGTTPTAPEESAEQLVEVTVEDIDRTVSTEGTIEAETTADEVFDVSGTVTEVLVVAGDEVVAGAALARIDSSELEAGVASARAALDDAEAALADATDTDASDTEVSARRSQVDAAATDLVAAVEDRAGATLTSPVDGTVAAVGYEVGDVLGSSGTDGTDMTGTDTGSGATQPQGDEGETTEGIQVVSTGTYVVTVDVDATEVDQLEVGQTARVTPTTSSSSSGGGGFGPPGGGGGPMVMSGDGVPTERSEALEGDGGDVPEAAGSEVEGTVTSVGAVASADSGVATFPVEITVEGSADEFFPGAVAEVEIVHDQIADAVTVSAMAVSQVDGQATVTVADGDRREERAVTTGITSGASIQVVDGLEAGEQVVVERPSFVGGGGPMVAQEGGG